MRDFKGTSLRWNISCMNTNFKELLLRIKLLGRWFSIDDLLRVDPLFDLSLFNQTFKRGQIWNMTRHVSGQNHADHSLSKRLELVLWELLEEIESFRVNNCKGFGDMEVFLNTLIVVTNCPWADWIYMIRVIQTVVCKIMANSCDYNAKSVQFVELGKLQQIALF